MNIMERRTEIMNILAAKRYTTLRELSEQLNVSMRTISSDINALSVGYPVYTKSGAAGGIFIMGTYRPYNNTLSPSELDFLKKLHRKSKGQDEKMLAQLIRKYGPAKAEI